MQKTKSILLMTALAFSLAACKEAPKSDVAATGDAKEVSMTEGATSAAVNTSASRVEWIGTKLSTYHSGTVAIKSGELQVKDGALSGGNFVMDMPTIIALNKDEASNKKLTGHLQSPDFFDVATYPESVFEITGITAFSGKPAEGGEMEEMNEFTISDPNVMISGNLKIKDITKNIQFPAKVTVNKTGVEAVAKFNINRKDWNIVYPGMPDDLIQDMIWFGISLKADAAATALK